MRDKLARHACALARALASLSPDILEAVTTVIADAVECNHSVYVVGNGGSAATASHMAADIAKHSAPSNGMLLPIFSLCDNAALLTALANDNGYESVFITQLERMMRPGDVLVAISATGESPNVVAAMRYARDVCAGTVALLGFGGGAAQDFADVAIVVDSYEFGVVEEVHLVIKHLIVELLRLRLEARPSFS